MRVAIALTAAFLICSVAHGGTVIYTGTSDGVRIVHPLVAYAADGITLMRGGVPPLRLPYTKDGYTGDLASGEFEWSIQLPSTQEAPPASFAYPPLALLLAMTGFTMSVDFVEGNTVATSLIVTWLAPPSGYPSFAESVVFVTCGATAGLDVAIAGEIPIAPGARRTIAIHRNPTTVSVECTSAKGSFDVVSVPLGTFPVSSTATVDVSAMNQALRLNSISTTSVKMSSITITHDSIPDTNNGESQNWRADVNEDTSVNAIDVQLVVNAALGLEIH